MLTRPIPEIAGFLYRLFQGHRKQAVLNTLIGILLVTLDLSFVWATKLAIDTATGHSTGTPLGHTFALLIAIMASRILLSVASKWVRALLGVKAQNSMRRLCFEHLLDSNWGELRKFHTGNLTNRLERDVADVVSFTTESIPTFVTTLLQFVGAFVFLFLMDRTLATIIVLILPFFILSTRLYVNPMRRISHEVRNHDSLIQSTLQETLQHALVVKTMQRTGYFIGKLAEQQEALHRSVLSRTRYSSISSALMSTGFTTGYLVTFIWGATSLAHGNITYGAFVAFIQLVGQIQSPVRSLSKFVPIFIGAFTAAERLMDIRQIPLETQAPPVKLQGPLGITIENLTFAYSEQSRKIFHHFNATIPPGSVAAIVGETGAGKTTLIRLLLALHTPQEGSVALTDTTGCRHTTQPCLRGNFTYVPQGNSLFSGTIRSNLLQAAPHADDSQLTAALHTAAADFVFKKPLGLDTPCGEEGDGLSEGQAQRIAIARALLTEGSILIFDEATSALDADTEKLILHNLITNYKRRTMIFITHRPAVLQYADITLRI